MGFLRQVFVGRGDHAHVHCDGLLAAEPLNHPGLEDPQELGLRLCAEVSHLVQKQRATVRELEAAEAALRRAGEGTALVAEHLRLHEVPGNCGAVDAHERAGSARALAVDRRCHELLPRARFPRDQDARLGGRDAGDERPHGIDPGAHADQGVTVPEGFMQPPVLGAGAGQLQRAAQRDEHALRGEGLLQELEGAELGGAHRIGEVRLAAHHDDRHVGRAPLQLFERRKPVGSTRHHQVEQHGVRGRALERGERPVSVRRLGGLEAFRLEQGAEHPPDVRLVVHYEDAWAHGGNTIVKVAPPPGVSSARIVARHASSV